MIKQLLNVFFLLSICVFTADLTAVPAQVLIIRHGEKPQTGVHLNTKGRVRAAALVPYFLETPELSKFGPPAAIFAQKQVSKNHSARPIETVAPLAGALNIQLTTAYAKNDYDEMVNEILSNPRYKGKTVLISWGHTVIGEIAQALGAYTAPAVWPDVYDRVWVITYRKNGKIDFADVPQRLLHGDSKK